MESGDKVTAIELRNEPGGRAHHKLVREEYQTAVDDEQYESKTRQVSRHCAEFFRDKFEGLVEPGEEQGERSRNTRQDSLAFSVRVGFEKKGGQRWGKRQRNKSRNHRCCCYRDSKLTVEGSLKPADESGRDEYGA